ncbi:MAG: hypothetical protein R3345_03505 [Fulvivirga sp.]|nr:hypothetical protein [Fulvivirga sp.]
MKRLIFLFFTLLFINHCLIAQDYVVTLQKDTIRGTVNILLPEIYKEELMITHDDDKERFKAFEVLSVRMDSQTYHPVKYANKYRLMKLEEGGYLSLYLFRSESSYDFNTYYLRKKTTEGMEVPLISFRKKMADFISTCHILAEKIENKTYRRDDLVKIVREYNQCLEEQTREMTGAVSSKKMTPQGQQKIALIENMKNKLSPDENSELITLLDDISMKIKNEQAVPGYLKSALKAETANIPAIQNEVQKLLELIDANG